jgi:hypothetical protein
MDSVTPTQQYRSLVESLRLVSASSTDQLQVLPGHVVATDEIVSIFGDSMLLLPQLERAGLVQSEGIDALRRVEEWVDSMPTDGSLAEASTLATHEYWERGRQLATDALKALGEEIRKPGLAWIAWVPGK